MVVDPCSSDRPGFGMGNDIISISSSSSCSSHVSPSVSTSTSLGSSSSNTSAPQSEVPSPKPIKLSKEQDQVLNLVKARKSVFFTGSAGTGKSVLLREIISWCRSSDICFAVTASTGIAAVNINGCTLHSWAGIGLGKESAEKLVGKIIGQDRWRRIKAREERKAKGLPPLPDESDSGQDDLDSWVVKRWRKCRVLIIDESESSSTCSAALHLTFA